MMNRGPFHRTLLSSILFLIRLYAVVNAVDNDSSSSSSPFLPVTSTMSMMTIETYDENGQNNDSSSSWIVVHFTYYVVEQLLRNHTREDACESSHHLLKEVTTICNDPEYNSHVCDSNVWKQCQRKVAKFDVDNRNNNHSILLPSTSPMYYLTIPFKTSIHNQSSTSSSTTKLTKKSSQYVQIGNDLFHDDTSVQSPFHVSKQLRRKDGTLLQNIYKNVVNTINNDDENDDSVIATITSSGLDEVGGMHRSYPMSIHLSSPNTTTTRRRRRRNEKELLFHNILGNITLLLPLSDGMFIDVDDPGNDCQVSLLVPVVPSSSSCNISLLLPTTTTTVIDIEQPTFVSPQHVLVFNIQFEIVSESMQDSLNLNIAPQLHFRYPLPTHHSTASSSSNHHHHQPIHLSKPIVYSGVYHHHHVGIQKTNTYSIFPSMDTENSDIPIIVYSATGSFSHWFVVTSTTAFVSSIGTICVLQQLSKNFQSTMMSFHAELMMVNQK